MTKITTALLTLLLLTSARAAPTQKISFDDQIRSISQSNGKIRVLFRKHAATYFIEEDLLSKAKAAQKQQLTITVVVSLQDRRIKSISAKTPRIENNQPHK